jgi:hypothetical protein
MSLMPYLPLNNIDLDLVDRQKPGQLAGAKLLALHFL